MTKKIKKFLFLSLASITTITSVAAVSISCSNYKLTGNVDLQIEKKLNTEFTRELFFNGNTIEQKSNYWELFKWVEGVVTYVDDGDTYKVTIDKTSSSARSYGPIDGKNQEISIRCWGIDTPEAPGSPSTYEFNDPNHKLEQQYSDWDTSFAKKTILNKRVRVILPGAMSYNRNIGLTFYSSTSQNPTKDEDFDTCYEQQVLYNGFSTPRISNDDFITFQREWVNFKDQGYYDTPQSLFLVDFAKAANNAIQNRRNFYKAYAKPYLLIDAVYKTHQQQAYTPFVIVPKYWQYPDTATAKNNLEIFLEEN